MLAELKFDVFAWYGSSNNAEGKDLEAGSIVEITGEYMDNGYWSNDDDDEFESPFPSYVFRLNGLEYCSVHKNCFNIIDNK